MLSKFLKFRRLLRTCSRSLWAALTGPDQNQDKMEPTFPYESPARSSLPAWDRENCAQVYFKKKGVHRLKQILILAKKSIDMQMFIWRADATGREIAGLLVEAANRGVRVTVRKEVIGDVFELADDFAATKEDPHPVWKAFWNNPNIMIRHENQHDHSKTYVIDHELLIVTSMNIGNAYCNSWHECLVELRGKKFVDSYHANTANTPRLTTDGHIEVLRSSAEQPMLPAVLSLLAGAKRSIRIEMAYFADPQVVELLAQKTHEGVFLFLVIPHSPDMHHHANMAAVSKLLSLAKKRRTFVFRYTRGFLHTKMIIIDRKTLFIGSTNLITSSLTKMGETNVLIHHYPRRALRQVRRQFTKDILQSVRLEAKELSLSYWHRVLSLFNL